MIRQLSRSVLLALGVAAIVVSGPSAQSGQASWSASAYLKASNPDEDDHLGAGNALTGGSLALSADGNTLAVAAPGEDSAARGINGNQRDNSAFDAGAVYVFTRQGASWVQQAYIKASNAQSGDAFGFALALSADGNTLAVSANFEDSGATGINGNQADESASGAGAVYVFTRSGTAWSQQAYIKGSNTEADDRFGYSVALSGDGGTLAVGAIGEDSAARGVAGNQADNAAQQSGAAYVFTRAGAAWSQQAYLKASNAEAADLFGFCVALSGDGSTLGVCGYDEDSSSEGVDGDEANNGSNGSGAAYVFGRTGTTWAQQAYLKSSNTTLQMAFGSALAVSGDGNIIAVTALDEDGLNPGVDAQPWQADRKAEERTRIAEDSAGAVYVYGREQGRWRFQTYLKSSNIRSNDYFGLRLALNRDGTVLAAGAPQQPGAGSGVNPSETEDSAPESGAVYVYARNGGRWTQDAYVKAPNAKEYDQFGSAVALNADGRILAVGAMMEDGGSAGVNGNQADESARDSGAVYVFTRR
jgi:hypothetical protein